MGDGERGGILETASFYGTRFHPMFFLALFDSKWNGKCALLFFMFVSSERSSVLL